MFFRCERTLKSIRRSTAGKRSFSKNIHYIDAAMPQVAAKDTSVLYRGIRRDVYESSTTVPLFRDRCFFLGISPYFYGRNLKKETINSDVIAYHKWDGKFVSTSKDYNTSRFFTDSRKFVLYIRLNNLPDVVLADSEKCFYETRKYWFGRGVILPSGEPTGTEQELTIFLLPYFSIEYVEAHTSFSERSIKIKNPFYLPIELTNTHDSIALQAIYDKLCSIYHLMFARYRFFRLKGVDSLKTELLLDTLAIYKRVLGSNNPYAMSVENFQNKFPDFSELMFNKNNGSLFIRYEKLKEEGGLCDTTLFELISQKQSIHYYANELIYGQGKGVKC